MLKLAKLTSGDLLSGGLYPGLRGEAPPLWANGSNVIFDSGGVRKAFGWQGLADLADEPTGLKSTVSEGEARLYVGAGQNAYLYTEGGGLNQIGAFTTVGGVYQFLPWDTWVLISNGVDPVELWQNAGLSAPITAPFNMANTLFGYQLQAFVGGTNNGGRMVEWSPVNAVTDWTATATGTAGNLLLRELGGDIVCAKKLGNSIGIYSSLDAGIFSFIGGTSIYGFRKPIRGVGALNPHSVVSVGDRHYGVTKENVFVTDLVSYKYIDDPAIRRSLREDVDWGRSAEVYGWFDWANNLVRWVMPLLEAVGNQTTFEPSYHIGNGTWTLFNDEAVIGEESGAFSGQFIGKAARLLRQDQTTYQNDGSDMPSYTQTKPLDLGDRGRYKRIMRLALDLAWSGDVTVDMAFTDTPMETPNFALSFAAATDIYPDQQNSQSEGVFLHLRITGDTDEAMWELSGAEIYGEFTGLVSA